MRMWDCRQPFSVSIFIGHTDEIFNIAYEDNILASASFDSTLRLWDRRLPNRIVKELHRMKEHNGIVSCVQFNDVNLMSSDSTGKIMFWDKKTFSFIRSIQIPDYEFKPAKSYKFRDSKHAIWTFQEDHNKIVAGCDDHIVRVLDINTGEIIGRFDDHSERVWGLQFDDTTLMTASEDGTFIVRDFVNINTTDDIPPYIPKMTLNNLEDNDEQAEDEDDNLNPDDIAFIINALASNIHNNEESVS